jgi:hypothetical protein
LSAKIKLLARCSNIGRTLDEGDVGTYSRKP